MEELLKLIEWQRLHGYDDIDLISELLSGILYNIEPFAGKLKYQPISIGWGSHATTLYKYQHKGVFLKYQRSWVNYKFADTFDCRLVIKDYKYNKGKYTTVLKFIVPDEQIAILYLSKLYTFKDLLIGRPQKIHYIPKKKDKCNLREFNDFKHRKGSYKKVSAGRRSEFVDDIHSYNRTDERVKLSKLKLNPTDYYNFNFATKLTREFSTYGSKSNYVIWSPWSWNWQNMEYEYDLETYNKYKRK